MKQETNNKCIETDELNDTELMKLIFQEVKHTNKIIKSNNEIQKNIKEVKVKLEEHEEKFKNIKKILEEHDTKFENIEKKAEIFLINDLNDYSQIILKDLESRISILEEETQHYEVN